MAAVYGRAIQLMESATLSKYGGYAPQESNLQHTHRKGVLKENPCLEGNLSLGACTFSYLKDGWLLPCQSRRCMATAAVQSVRYSAAAGLGVHRIPRRVVLARREFLERLAVDQRRHILLRRN